MDCHPCWCRLWSPPPSHIFAIRFACIWQDLLERYAFVKPSGWCRARLEIERSQRAMLVPSAFPKLFQNPCQDPIGHMDRTPAPTKTQPKGTRAQDLRTPTNRIRRSPSIGPYSPQALNPRMPQGQVLNRLHTNRNQHFVFASRGPYNRVGGQLERKRAL